MFPLARKNCPWRTFSMNTRLGLTPGKIEAYSEATLGRMLASSLLRPKPVFSWPWQTSQACRYTASPRSLFPRGTSTGFKVTVNFTAGGLAASPRVAR